LHHIAICGAVNLMSHVIRGSEGRSCCLLRSRGRHSCLSSRRHSLK